jgi:HAD superfamily hydrolase (TIGR01509 family)
MIVRKEPAIVTRGRARASEVGSWTKADFRAVAFDLDGTLADTLPAMEASWNEVLGPIIGRRIPPEEIVGSLGPRLVEIVRRYDRENADSLSKALSERFRAVHRTHVRLYPGIAELIQELIVRRYNLAVVTSMGRPSALSLLGQFDLIEHFTTIVTESDVAHMKPDPEPVLMTAEQLHMDPSELLVVGDHPVDMQAARAAGAGGGAALWGFNGDLAAPFGNWTFEHPNDVLKVCA